MTDIANTQVLENVDNVQDGVNQEGEINDVQTTKERTFTQSDVDRMVGERLSRERQKLEKEKEASVSEAIKLQKMNADEKAKYEQQQRLDELTKREADITTRELKAQAYETLAEKGLPKELVEILNYTDADTCNKSIEAVNKAFQSAVEKATNEKLRGGSTPKAGSSTNNGLQSIIANAMRGK